MFLYDYYHFLEDWKIGENIDFINPYGIGEKRKRWGGEGEKQKEKKRDSGKGRE